MPTRSTFSTRWQSSPASFLSPTNKSFRPFQHDPFAPAHFRTRRPRRQSPQSAATLCGSWLSIGNANVTVNDPAELNHALLPLPRPALCFAVRTIAGANNRPALRIAAACRFVDFNVGKKCRRNGRSSARRRERSNRLFFSPIMKEPFNARSESPLPSIESSLAQSAAARHRSP